LKVSVTLSLIDVPGIVPDKVTISEPEEDLYPENIVGVNVSDAEHDST
jgi:hypothetical protein